MHRLTVNCRLHAARTPSSDVRTWSTRCRHRHKHSGNRRDRCRCTRRCRPSSGARSDAAASTEGPPAPRAYPQSTYETRPPGASAPFLLPRIVGWPRIRRRGAPVQRAVACEPVTLHRSSPSKTRSGRGDQLGNGTVMWAAPGSLVMHLHVSQFLGFAGVALGFVGYMPQVVHLVRQRCSAGISVQAYLIWLSAAILLLTHALLIYDGVFIVLQALGAVLDIAVLFLAIKYRETACPDH